MDKVEKLKQLVRLLYLSSNGGTYSQVLDYLKKEKEFNLLKPKQRKDVLKEAGILFRR